jgi:type IV fimbrial biogenesis protein FimT
VARFVKNKGDARKVMKQQSGFTLIEWMVCLAVLAILTAITLPMASSVFQRNHIDVLSHEIQNALQYTKNLVLSQGHPMIITPIPGTKDWSHGMIVFQDNANHQYTDQDKIRHQWDWHYPGVTINWNGFLSPDYLIFSNEIRQATSSGSFHVYLNGVEKKIITVNRIGHVRVGENHPMAHH